IRLNPCLLYYFLLTLRPPPCSSLFPYTTLFRSLCICTLLVLVYFRTSERMEAAYGLAITITMLMTTILLSQYLKGKVNVVITKRSEEHTSELQSRFDLVCRLLLEKKKKQRNADE